MNEKLKTYASMITAVFSALVVLYGVFRFVNTGNETAKSNKEIKASQQVMTVKLDSIENVVRGIESKTNEVIKGQNALRNSYSNYLKRDKTLTLNDFTNFMNGISWIVSPLTNDKANDVKVDSFKISIKKK